MIVGILGGTGPAGKALAARLASVGLEVRVGSRQQSGAPRSRPSFSGAGRTASSLLAGRRTRAPATPTSSSWRRRGTARADGGRARRPPRGQGRRLDGERPRQGRARVAGSRPAPRLIAVAVQQACPGALVAGAFHHLPARELGDLEPSSMPTCSYAPTRDGDDGDHRTRRSASRVVAASTPARCRPPRRSRPSPRCSSG